MSEQEIGKEVIVLDTVGSTNKEAADRLALSQLAHGTVILAHEQTEGRGQRGRNWISRAHQDLTFSVALLPKHMKATDAFALAKISALAVADVVAPKVLGETRVKWPNDVLVDRRKICGILIKTEVVGGMVQSAIIGIGLNVNSRELDEAYLPTSLRMETGQEHDRMQLLKELCTALDRRWKQLTAQPVAIRSDYSDRLWSVGRWCDFELDGQPFSGRPLDVDAEGRLLVESATGQVVAYGLDRLRFAAR